LKTINLLLILSTALLVALILKPSLAVAMPLCFLIVAVVIVFYIDFDDYRKIKAVDKRIDLLESQLNILKTTVNYKNL
jgi:hypothetical protein